MHLSQRSRAQAVLAIAAALLSSTVVVGAIQWTQFESAARGYPVMLDASTGRRIGNGTFAQWIEKGRLHVAITYAGAGRRIEERVVLTQRPELGQDSWSFAEWRDQKPVRRFDVDFRSGHAVAQVWTAPCSTQRRPSRLSRPWSASLVSAPETEGRRAATR